MMEQKKRKPTNHKTKKKTPSKRPSLYATLKEALSWRDSNPGPKFIRAMIDKLEEWVSNESNTDIYSFFTWFGIPSSVFYEWCDKHTELAVAHEMVMEILGVRRLARMEEKKYGCNENMIKISIHEYHPMHKKIFKEEQEFKKQLKHEAEEQAQRPINIIIPEFKDSD